MNVDTRVVFDSMEDAVAYYWHYEAGFSEALQCVDNPACPRHGKNTPADRKLIAADRDTFMVDMCRILVDTWLREDLRRESR